MSGAIGNHAGEGVVGVAEEVGRPDPAQFPALLPEECGPELFPGDGIGSAGIAVEVGKDTGCRVGGIGVGDQGDVDAEAVIAPVDRGRPGVAGGEGLAQGDGEGGRVAGGLDVAGGGDRSGRGMFGGRGEGLMLEGDIPGMAQVGVKVMTAGDGAFDGAVVEVFFLGDGSEDMDAFAGAGDEHVEASLTTGAGECSEIAFEPSVGSGTERGGEDEMIAFVALDILEILHEEAFEGAGALPGAGDVESGGKLGIGSGAFIQEVEDEIPLGEVEAGDADGRRCRQGEELGDEIDGGAGFGFVAAIEVDAVDLDQMDGWEGGGSGGIAWNGLESGAVEGVVGVLDQGGVSGAVVDIEEGFLDGEVEGGTEQILGTDLLLVEDFHGIHRFGFVGIGRGGFEEAGWRELTGIAGDDDASGTEQDGEGFFQPALAGFVEQHDVEDRFTREDLGDGCGTGHPDGAEVEEGIAVGGAGAGEDHLPEFEGALTPDEEALSEGCAERIEAGTGGGEEPFAPALLPSMEDERPDLARLDLGEFAEFIQGGLDALGIDPRQRGLGLDAILQDVAQCGGLERGQGLVRIELASGRLLKGRLDRRRQGCLAGGQSDGVFQGIDQGEEIGCERQGGMA